MDGGGGRAEQFPAEYLFALDRDTPHRLTADLDWCRQQHRRGGVIILEKAVDVVPVGRVMTP
jgi:hypothetical protein